MPTADEGYKLYNTTVRLVDLVWARSEEEATKILAQSAKRLRDVDLLDADAFVSEPVESEGWDG